MSGRFVRASKYRHVHGEPNRKDKCYLGIKANSTGEGNFIKGNTKFLAYCGTGGGGPVIVHKREELGRMDANPGCVNVHKAAVYDIEFSPFMENMISTGAEDGYVKISVFPEDGLKPKENIEEATATLAGHGKKVSLLHWHPTCSNILGSCSFDNTVKVWDLTKQAEAYSFEFPDLPQGFEWNSNGSLLVVACKDKTVRVYDPRVSQAVMSAPGFSGAKGSRPIWMDNHKKLAVIGFSATSTRQYAVYDPAKFDAPLDVVDIDQSAGVFMPYYDPDNSILYLGGKGDGVIRYYECVDEAPYLHFLSEFRSNESQKGLAFLPKKACDTKSCEIAVALRLMVDYIQPVSFQVPRKSDQFQEDLYPDTYAGIHVLEVNEYLEGKNKEPPTISMRPGAQGDKPQPKPALGISKPSAVLEKELASALHQLDDAKKKIADLEAELAKLKGH